MTSFLFVVKIPKDEGKKSTQSSEEKPEDNENKKKIDNEGEEVSKDANQESSGNAEPTKTDKPEQDTKGDKPGEEQDSKGDKPEAEADEGWDFGEDESTQPVEGEEVPKSEGECGDGAPVSEEGSTTVTQGKSVNSKDVGKTETRDQSIANEIKKEDESTGQDESNTAQNTKQGVTSTDQTVIKVIIETSEPGKQGDVEKGDRAAENNNEQSAPPPKKTFTVEIAKEDSLKSVTDSKQKPPATDSKQKPTATDSKQNPPVQLENSDAVPPPTLQAELSVPKSMSGDNLSVTQSLLGDRLSVTQSMLGDQLSVTKSLSAVDMSNNFETVSFLEEEPLIEVVKRVIGSFSIDNFSIQETDNGNFYQVIFVDEGGERCENILNQLAKENIGDKQGTSISIFPASIYRGNIPTDAAEETEEVGEEIEDNKEAGETPFKKSIKARMMVTQVFNTVRDNAQFTFDYLVLIVVASLLACLGLVENSSVILVASMLVSPLMGPILGGTFGTVMQNKALRNLGIKNELIGLFICVISGLLFGIISGSVSIRGAYWGSTDSWPTNEMKARGVVRGLWVGVFIALPSGVGVALSVLGGNAGSLVGVAISASLLPPAVNAGMLWMYSVISAISPPDRDVTYRNLTVGNASYLEEVYTATETLGCKPFLNNKYSPVHSCDMATEALILGLISLTLTLLNILCIFLMGITFLKIKEVAPQHTTTDATRDFWNEDIQVSKESYSTFKGPQSMQLASQARKLLEEWKQAKGDTAENTLKFQEMLEDVENSPEYSQFLPTIGGMKLYSRYLLKDFRSAQRRYQEDYIPESRVVEEKTKSGYNVYKTYHGLNRSLRKRTKPRVSFNLQDETPTKPVPRPMSDGHPGKISTNKQTGASLELRSDLYTRRTSKDSKSRDQETRFAVSKVQEKSEEPSPSTDVKNPLLNASDRK